MTHVEAIVEAVIRREGGFVNDPVDRGGATNFGITQATLSRYYGFAATVDDVRNLTVDVAKEIYLRNYYYGPSIDSLHKELQPFLFDSAVNHGARRAIMFAQGVCNQAGYRPLLQLDGAVGPNTRKGIEWAHDVMGMVYLKALVEERRNFYRVIVLADPKQKRFLNGWMNRVNEFDREAA